MASASELRELRRIAESQGWRVEMTRSGHWRFIPPTRSARIVVMPGTSVSRSGYRNALADLKRSGLVLESRDAPSPRGVRMPIRPNYILAVYPYPFGSRVGTVGWHVYHVDAPHVYVASGEADGPQDAKRKAESIFRHDRPDPRAAMRDGTRTATLSAREEAIAAERARVLYLDGYARDAANVLARNTVIAERRKR